MNIFLSHASEDKDFARPLAEALSATHNVWFDEYELTVGDSLVGKIDEGLKKADFGVVVLSRFFFAKKWPRAELDGLFALEPADKKLILPIWRDVEEADVKQFSPILAGRLGSRASEGIPRVVESLNRAMEVAIRVSGFSESASITERLRAVATGIGLAKRDAQLIESYEGAELIWNAVCAITDTLRENVSLLESTVGLPFKVGIHNPAKLHRDFTIQAPYGLVSQLHYNSAVNSANGAKLRIALFIAHHDAWGEWKSNDKLSEEQLLPHFDASKSVYWVAPNITLSSEQIPDYVLGSLATQVEKIFKQSRK